ncbi:catalase family protein [uncultured Jannaschia sp.]|uniref:catalase family protein n=1 Tax=uncultured Jannaschia sp. TaxID=293347 RepID=UPI002610D693|nr:catalase family protein [uncultured Jannaschia sp.]
MKQPVPFHPDVEMLSTNEAEVVEGLNDALTDIMDTTSKDLGHAVRSVHAKSHGLIEAELEVLDDMPPELAQGLFAHPGAYSALIRISTNPGDILDDSVSVPRGLALKVLDVEGPRLAGVEGSTQDFVMVNAPAFAAPDAESFLGNLKLLAKTTDRAEWAKKALSAVLRGAESAVEAAGGESAALKTLGGAPNVHPLGETYYTQTPYRYGEWIAKLSLAPVSDSLTRHTGQTVSTSGRSDALREEVDAAMQEGEAVWEFRVQLCRDLETMPVEDASAVWDEAASPYLPVARLRAGAQTGWSQARADVIDERMRFSPWTGLEAHRPLGSVNRARKPTYEMSATYRAQVNGCPVHEPLQATLPD